MRLFEGPSFGMIPALSAVRILLVSYLVVALSSGVFIAATPAFAGLQAGLTGLFVLGGFLIGLRTGDSPSVDALAPLKRRLLVLLGLHISIVALALLLSGGAVNTALGVELALIHAWIPLAKSYSGVSPLGWILSAQAVFLVLAAFLAPTALRAMLVASFVGALFLVAVAAVAGLPVRAVDQVDVTGLVVVHPFARLFEFVLGLTAARHAETAAKRWSPSGAALATALEAAALLVAGGALFLLAASGAGLTATFGQAIGLFLSHALAAPVFAAALLILSWQRGYLTRGLPGRPLEALAEIALPALLVHAVLVATYVRIRPFVGWSIDEVFAAILVADLVIALAITRLILRPMAAIVRQGRILPGAGFGSTFMAGLRSPFSALGVMTVAAITVGVLTVWRPGVFAEEAGPPPDISRAGDCVIDSVVARGQVTEFNGWHVNRDDMSVPTPVVLRLIGDGRHYAADAIRVPRRDVARHFKSDAFLEAGYRGSVTAASMPWGTFTLRIETGIGRARRACTVARRIQSDGNGVRFVP